MMKVKAEYLNDDKLGRVMDKLFIKGLDTIFLKVAFKAAKKIKLTYGGSRDHRPDFKQFIIELICSGDGDIPIFLKLASGNQADSSCFGQIAVDDRKQLEVDSTVADCALYSGSHKDSRT
ncbi:DUF4277 domain-containing protein [Microcoleus sp. F8-D3]